MKKKNNMTSKVIKTLFEVFISTAMVLVPMLAENGITKAVIISFTLAIMASVISATMHLPIVKKFFANYGGDKLLTRVLLTFVQTFIVTITAAWPITVYTDLVTYQSVLMSILMSAIAAGITAVLNLPFVKKFFNNYGEK